MSDICNNKAEWAISGRGLDNDILSCTRHLSAMVSPDTIKIISTVKGQCCFVCTDSDDKLIADLLRTLHDVRETVVKQIGSAIDAGYGLKTAGGGVQWTI